MRPQPSSEEAFYGLKASTMLSISPIPYLNQSDLILDPAMFDDQDFPHFAVDDRPAIYSFVYSLKESFAGENLFCNAVNVRIC